MRSVEAITFIVENFLAVENFFIINTINFQFNYSLSLYQIALHCYLAQYVTFYRAPLIMMIWINLGGDKHNAALHSAAMCQYGKSGCINILSESNRRLNRDNYPSC